MNHQITPVGYVRSPYKEKFAVPRQPGLVTSAKSEIVLCGEANNEESVRGITQFSHLWLLFLFDQNIDKGWTPTVRPPRLGGNERIGVFASRATFRPNAIGMSAVELKGIRKDGNQVIIELGNVDLVDGTPIIDIKPYIPYSDSLPAAIGGFASDAPATLPVSFSESAIVFLDKQDESGNQKQVITEVLAQDPRPAYKKKGVDNKVYAVNLFNYNVRFQVSDDGVVVTDIEFFGE